MGAEVFYHRATGATPQEAFNAAVQEAQYNWGHGGYTGSIAEKDSFTMIEVPEGRHPHAFAEELVEDGDERVDDKWGPAGCVKIGENAYLFFGWASS